MVWSPRRPPARPQPATSDLGRPGRAPAAARAPGTALPRRPRRGTPPGPGVELTRPGRGRRHAPARLPGLRGLRRRRCCPASAAPMDGRRSGGRSSVDRTSPRRGRPGHRRRRAAVLGSPRGARHPSWCRRSQRRGPPASSPQRRLRRSPVALRSGRGGRDAAKRGCDQGSHRPPLDSQLQRHGPADPRGPTTSSTRRAGSTSVAESVTITDNRTGRVDRDPHRQRRRRRREWKKLLGNTWFYDPAFTQTAATSSAITEIDGENGHPPLPRLPHRAAGRALHLPRGRLPADLRRAAHRRAVREWKHEITYHTFIHENVRKRFMEGFHHDAHPMGMLVSAVRRPVDLLPRGQGDPGRRGAATSRSCASSPRCPPSPPAPPLQRRAAVRLPRQLPRLRRQLPLDDVEDRRAPLRAPTRSSAHALDVLFILHADHEQNCGTAAMRVIGSSHADPYSACAGAAAALYGPRHGGANEAVIKMLNEIGRIDNVEAFVEEVKAGQGAAPGLRPPRLQELRPAGHDHQEDRLRRLRRHRQEPAARHRPQARGGRARRRLLHQPQALPQRRLLLRA